MVAFVVYCIFSVPLLIASQFVFDWRNYVIALMVPILSNYFLATPLNISYPVITLMTMALLILTNLSVANVSIVVIAFCYFVMLQSYMKD
jgi:hypothetical protein